MALELQRFAYTYPELLTPQVEAFKAATLSGLFRFELIDRLEEFTHPALKSLKDRKEVNASLAKYRGFMNENNMNILSRLYTKKGRYLPLGSFLLSDPFTGHGYWGTRQTGGNFFIDGTYGFALGFRQSSSKDPIWLSVISFSDISYSSTYRFGFLKFDMSNIPLILQLQGPASDWINNKNDKRLAVSILKNLRWESLMVGVITDWVRASGFNSLYFLPADMNGWSKVYSTDRGKVRYDGTATHNGFKKDPATGLFLKNL